MDRIRIYRAALDLDNFSIGELAAHAGAKPNTVRNLVTSREPDLFEKLGRDAREGPGRPAQRYRLLERETVEQRLSEQQQALTGSDEPRPATAVPAIKRSASDDLLLTLAYAESQIARAADVEHADRDAVAKMAQHVVEQVLGAAKGVLDDKAVDRAHAVLAVARRLLTPERTAVRSHMALPRFWDEERQKRWHNFISDLVKPTVADQISAYGIALTTRYANDGPPDKPGDLDRAATVKVAATVLDGSDWGAEELAFACAAQIIERAPELLLVSALESSRKQSAEWRIFAATALFADGTAVPIAMRRSAREHDARAEDVIDSVLRATIRVAKSGLTVAPVVSNEFRIADRLVEVLAGDHFPFAAAIGPDWSHPGITAYDLPPTLLGTSPFELFWKTPSSDPRDRKHVYRRGGVEMIPMQHFWKRRGLFYAGVDSVAMPYYLVRPATASSIGVHGQIASAAQLAERAALIDIRGLDELGLDRMFATKDHRGWMKHAAVLQAVMTFAIVDQARAGEPVASARASVPTAARKRAAMGRSSSKAPLTAAKLAEQHLRKRLMSADQPASRLRLGLCLAAQGRDDEALAECVLASDDSDTVLAIRALLQRVRLCPSEAMRDVLLQSAEERLSADANPEAVVDVANALAAAGQFSQAARLQERMLSASPAPAPPSEEHIQDRRARAVATLRLAELRIENPDYDDADAVKEIDNLLQEAIDANDPTVTPLAALRLAIRREDESRPAQGCAADALLRDCWAYDHPRVSSRAGRRLAELYEQRGNHVLMRKLLDALSTRADDDTVVWARARLGALGDDRSATVAAARRTRPAMRGVEGADKRRRRLRTLIVGAGSGGRRLLYELNPERVEVTGLLDDLNIGSTIAGKKVIGRIDDLGDVLRDNDIDQVLLAIPTAPPDLRRNVGLVCAEFEVWLRVLPNPFELLVDRLYVRQLRPLRADETFGSDPVVVDPTAGASVQGKSVLIVGAADGIGAELSRQVVARRPRHLALLALDEGDLVELVDEIKDGRRFSWTFPILGDVTDRNDIRSIMRTHEPDIVFIAGGIDNAEVAEESIVHTARINVLGPWIVTEEAIQAGAERVILVSSDNLAHMRGALDWTKALAERAVLSPRANGTCVSVVRLGNVFGTAGSVTERFIRQIKRGGPLTVTSSEASRRFLTVHEAAQWLLLVAATAENRAVYAVDAGVNVNIMELAERMLALRGLQVPRDVTVKTGHSRLREKTSHALWADNERIVATPPYSEVVRIVGEPWSEASLLDLLSKHEPQTEAKPECVELLLRQGLEFDGYEPDLAAESLDGGSPGALTRDLPDHNLESV